VVSNPVEMTSLNIFLRRELAGVPHPRRMRQLVACLAPLHVSRVDARTLRIRPERGFFEQEFMHLTRGTSLPPR
jgi:hypothetical protein